MAAEKSRMAIFLHCGCYEVNNLKVMMEVEIVGDVYSGLVLAHPG